MRPIILNYTLDATPTPAPVASNEFTAPVEHLALFGQVEALAVRANRPAYNVALDLALAALARCDELETQRDEAHWLRAEAVTVRDAMLKEADRLRADTAMLKQNVDRLNRKLADRPDYTDYAAHAWDVGARRINDAKLREAIEGFLDNADKDEFTQPGTFRVQVKATTTFQVTVEAMDEDEAIEKAQAMCNRDAVITVENVDADDDGTEYEAESAEEEV